MALPSRLVLIVEDNQIMAEMYALRLGAVAYLVKAQTTPASLAGTLAELMVA